MGVIVKYEIASAIETDLSITSSFMMACFWLAAVIFGFLACSQIGAGNVESMIQSILRFYDFFKTNVIVAIQYIKLVSAIESSFDKTSCLNK